MNYISGILGNAYARSISDTRTILPFMFLIATTLIFTFINTMYAYDNSESQDKCIRWCFYFFIVTSIVFGILYYVRIDDYLDTIKYHKIIDSSTSLTISTIFKKCVDLVFWYTVIIGVLFILMDIRAKVVYQNINIKLVDFAKNQLYLIDIPLIISAFIAYFLSLKLKTTGEWLDNVYSFFSIGLLIMQIIFSQITFFILKSKYVLENK